MKITRLKKITVLVAGFALVAGLAACGGGSGTNPSTSPTDTKAASAMGAWDKNGDGLITVGFCQTGAESGWRTANTQSFQAYFTEANGFKLVFEDANGDDATQKGQFRDLVQQGVEVIVVQPLTNDGWQQYLQEAKDAGIPVINSDRQLTGMDNLYTFFFGSDMKAEGDRAVEWLAKYITDNKITDPINIVHLQGQMGSTAQVGRSQGLDAGVAKYGWKVVATQTGAFARDKGQAAMVSILNSIKSTDFNVLYSENDDMTYGAIDAMVAKGMDPTKYIIISFDGNKTAMQMVVQGKIKAISQCNPLLGPQVGDLIKRASKGETIPSPQYSQEVLIDINNAQQMLDAGQTFGS